MSGLKHFEHRTEPVHTLASYWSLGIWRSTEPHIDYVDWVLDSGAFSAHNSGAPISLEQYTEQAAELVANDPKLAEVYALDVVGNPEASATNTDYMWGKGVHAIPTFHMGSDWDALRAMVDDERFEKIALGGMAKYRRPIIRGFIAKAFEIAWPKRIHAFGMTDRRVCEEFPFHSVDSTSWEFRPAAFGEWKTYGRLSSPGDGLVLAVEVDWFLALQKRLRFIHRASLARVEETLQ